MAVRRPQVLVVEDERPLAEAIALNLREEGFAVTVAHRGDEALRLALSQSFQLVVLDWMLPGLDGREVCRRLRAQSRVPILMLTARGSVEDRVRGLEGGADDYLVKPFSMLELIARLRALLRRAEAGAEVAEALVFPDHYRYGPADVDRIRGRAAGRPIITTAKDAIKLRPLADGLELWVLEQAVVPEEGADALVAVLDRLARAGPEARRGRRGSAGENP